MMVGFFGPWMTSCQGVDRWGNTPYYLTEYGASQSAGIPMLGSGYIYPEVYFGFEVAWIYLIGWFKFFGAHTFFFPMGLGAFSVIIYSLLSLAIFFYGNALKSLVLRWIKVTAILGVIGMAWGGLKLFSDSYYWHYSGYGITFLALIVSVIFEFRNLDLEEIGAAINPALWFRTTGALIICGLFLPMVFVLRPSTSSTASDCDVLTAFVVPDKEWEAMDEEALEAWILASPHFDNLVDKGPFGNTNNLDYWIKWWGYGHKGQYEADFTDHYLRVISASVSSGIPIEFALECFGEPDAYLAYIEYSSTGFDSLLVQLWYPTKGIVLNYQDVDDYVQPPEINGQLKIGGINFVQSGSIEAIADRAFLLDSSWLFPNWVEFIKPWPGSLQDIQVIEITE
jgi:hypothetical protein